MLYLDERKAIFMLGILFIYFIGKYFYELAKTYEKNKWLFAILGILSYYVGGILIGAGIVIFASLIEITFFETMDETALGIMIIPFGLISCYLFYYILKRNWSKNFKVELEEIENIGRTEDTI